MNRFTRILLFGCVLCLAVLIIMSWVVESRVNRALDKGIALLSPFATASYDDVDVNLWGSRISISNLEFEPYGDDYPAIRADRWSLELDDNFFFKQALGVSRKSAPDTATVIINGLRLPVDTYSVNRAIDQNNEDFRAQYEPNCGDIEFLGFHELSEIGYQYPYAVDAEFSYRFDRPGQRMLVELQFLIPGMARLEADLEIDDVPASPTPQLLTQAYVSQLDITYSDLGYVNRISNYCAGRENISLAEYIQRQTQRPDASFATQWGVVPDQDIRALYGEFLKLPRTIHWRISPDRGFDLKHLELYEKKDWANMLRLEMMVNGQSVDLKGFSLPPEQAGLMALWDNTSPADSSVDHRENQATLSKHSTHRSSSRVSYQSVPVDQLASHIGRAVRIKEHNGKVREGYLKRCNQDSARIAQRLLHGGEFSVAVKLQDIALAEVQM